MTLQEGKECNVSETLHLAPAYSVRRAYCKRYYGNLVGNKDKIGQNWKVYWNGLSASTKKVMPSLLVYLLRTDLICIGTEYISQQGTFCISLFYDSLRDTRLF